MRTILAALTVFGFIPLLLGKAHSARDYTLDDFEVIIPISTLNTPASGSTLGKLEGRLTALADGQVCDSADLATATADVVLRLGLPGQAAACSLDGARVTFRNARGMELFVEMTLRKGTVETLRNLAPKPPDGVTLPTTTAPSG